MAIYHEDIVNINLESGNIHRSFAKHSIGSADNLANRFGVRVYRDGAEVDLSGCSCYGYFRNSNGDNIALTSAGTVDGNVAYVTLPQACYNYEGQFTLTIKLIGGGITGTMRIVDGMVDNTNTGSAVAPTETVPSYTEILETYDAMVAATAAANTAIAPAFAQGTANAAGALVINDGALYILPNGHTAGTTWANTTKIATNCGEQITNLKSALYSNNNLIYTFTKNDMESGYWSYSTKTDNSKRLRNAQLTPVKKGTVVKYSNPSQKVYFGVLETKTSNTYLQTAGWISSGGSGEVFINYDGFMTFMVESSVDITVDDFAVSAKLFIPPTQKEIESLQRESQLADALSTGNLNVEWEQGGLVNATGIEYDSSTNIRSNYINVTPGEWIGIAGLDFTNFYYIMHKFSAVGTQEGEAIVIYTPYVKMTTPLVRFRITKNPNTNAIVPSDANVIFYRNDGYLNRSSFTIRNVLGSGDNIDTLFITGNYNIYSSNVDNVGGTFPSQLPTRKACSIIVISTEEFDGRGTIQIISTISQAIADIGEKPFAFLRRYNGTNWERWISLTQQMGLVRNNTDINTIVDAGQYSFTAVDAETLTGLPNDFVTAAGVLVVCSGDGSIGRTVQIIYSSANKSWTRYHNDNYDAQDSSVGWTEWKRANENRYMLSGGTDINRLYEPGQYSFYGITEILGKPVNFGGTPGVLQVVGGSGTYARITQTIQNMYNETWTRYHNDDYDSEDSSVGWTEWKQQVNSLSIRADEDINTYINSGEYSFTGVIASTLTGLPLSWAGPGVLNVITGTKTVGRTIQVLYSYNNETYIRYHNDDYDPEDSSVGWTEWKSMDQTGFDARRYIKRKPNASLKPIGIPAVFVYGDMTGISHDTAVNITWKYVTNAASGTGTVSSDTYTGTLKWQGRGSLNFPKKNYTLKSDTKYDFGWGQQKKYVLKGNWLDPAMANNLLGAKLWGEIAADHSATYPAQLVSSPNYGAVDGFPVMLYLNDEYSGVYDLNIPKDKWMANMTLAEGTTECMVCSDASTDTCGWAALAETLEDLQTGWCLEELSKGIDDGEGQDKYTGVALRALNQAIGAVMTAYTNQDRNWEQTVGQYIDIDSAIDFYILRCLIDDRDAMRNNQLLFTYNLADPLENPETPTKWYFIPYDMDMTFGATNRYYSDEIIYKIGDNRFKVYAQASQNLLFYLIYNYSRDRLMARYTAIRDYHMAYRNVYFIYANIAGQIPARLMEQEHILYPLTPADNVMSMTQAMLHYRINCEVCDADLYDET